MLFAGVELEFCIKILLLVLLLFFVPFEQLLVEKTRFIVCVNLFFAHIAGLLFRDLLLSYRGHVVKLLSLNWEFLVLECIAEGLHMSAKRYWLCSGSLEIERIRNFLCELLISQFLCHS